MRMNKNVSKRMLAVLVALMMCLSMLPGTAFAADEECPKNSGYAHEFFGGICKYCGATQGEPECTHPNTHEEVTGTSCMQAGEWKRVCDSCSEVIEKHDCPPVTHEYNEEGKCKYCGRTETEIKQDTCNHTKTTENVMEATCQKDGWKQIVCADCEKVLSEGPCPKLSHEYLNGKCKYCGKCINDHGDCHEVTKTEHPATCMEAGWVEYKCEYCGYTLPNETTEAALGHAWTEWDQDDPTCTEDGKKGRHCTRCSLTETEVLSKTDHDWDDGVVTTEPTATTPGVMTFTCKNDPTHTRTEEIPALGNGDGDNNNPGDGEENPGNPGDGEENPGNPGDGEENPGTPGGDNNPGTTTPPTTGTVTPPTGGDEPTVTPPETNIDDNDTPLTSGTDAVDNAQAEAQQPDETDIADAETPLVGAPETDIADAETPLAVAPETEIDDAETPLAVAPETDIADEEAPLAANPDMGDAETDIVDAEVPVSGVPVTGDASQIWGLSALLSLAGLLWLVLDGKKRQAADK